MKYVRVELENGVKATVSEALAERAGLKVLDEPALDRRGKPVADEHPGEEQDTGDKPPATPVTIFGHQGDPNENPLAGS